MVKNVLVDAGFLVALLSKRDHHHEWAKRTASNYPPPWRTCEAALSEAFHLVEGHGSGELRELLSRTAVLIEFDLSSNLDSVLKLMQKYTNVPMSLADACLVRMTEILTRPVLLTSDTDFRIYRRLTRKVVPSIMP